VAITKNSARDRLATAVRDGCPFAITSWLPEVRRPRHDAHGPATLRANGLATQETMFRVQSAKTDVLVWCQFYIKPDGVPLLADQLRWHSGLIIEEDDHDG
jgi:hypothetical protein